MHKNTLKGDWNLVKGKIKEQWGKLTDDDLTEISGRRDQLLGKIQKNMVLPKTRQNKKLLNGKKDLMKIIPKKT